MIRLLTEKTQLAALALFAILLAIPILLDSPFIHHVFVTIFVYGALATAWNIVGGYAGQLSLGHTIFYGIGGYVAALLIIHFGLSPWIGMFGGAAMAMVVGMLISYPCFRLRGPFFALSTIAFLEVIRLLVINQHEWTAGAAGLIVPLQIGLEWMIFREKWPYLLISAGFLLVTILVSLFIAHSKFGYYLVATREREDAARAAGINTVRMKLYAVAISAGLTAMVGSFHGVYTTFLEPESQFSLGLAIQIAMFALIGGLGTVYGPIAGTLLIVPIAELARGWLGSGANGLHGFAYGVTLVVIVLLMPRGVVGKLSEIFSRFGGTATGPDTPATTRTEAGRQQLDGTPPPIGDVILEAQDLDKHFGGLHATDNVSLNLRDGEILGIIGPNGAGKTTLFNQLSGFIRPDRGSVRLRDEQRGWTQPTQPHEFARNGIGRTFQIVQPFGDLSVLENILVGAFHNYPSRADATAKATEIAEIVGLSPELHVKANDLTISSKKRLEVARVLALEPKILLLDEVMAGQNQADINGTIDMVRRIRDSGISIIAIEHVMHAIMSLSDRILVINSGRVIAEGSPAEIAVNPAVIEAYLGEEYVHAQDA